MSLTSKLSSVRIAKVFLDVKFGRHSLSASQDLIRPYDFSRNGAIHCLPT